MPPERLQGALDRHVANRVLAPAPISRVANNRMSNVGQVNSNLVSSAGLDLHIQQGEVLIALGNFEDRMRGPARASSKHTHAGAVVRAASDARVYFASLFGHMAIHERDV